nr:hypothetical protein [Candidatus Krumholzibacteria bacterium]
MWRWPFIVSVLLALLSPTASESGPDTGLGFSPINEPNENAFTILVPTGWKSQGGIFRVNAAEMGGPLNALVAKCDLAFTSPDGMVMFHILPDIVYAHVGIGGGFWQPGSVYQGAVVRQLESAEQHLMSLFNYHHSQAGNAQVLKSGPLPWEIEALRRASAYSNQLLAQIGGQTMTSEFDAAAMMVEYTEQGVRYRSVMATGIVNQRAAMTWNNTRTLEFRAPAAEFDRWRPVMDVMRYSVRFNLPWVLKETNNQREQADFIMKVFQESNRIDQEMLAKSRVNREEIMND